jgi:hypothetical protein
MVMVMENQWLKGTATDRGFSIMLTGTIGAGELSSCPVIAVACDHPLAMVDGRNQGGLADISLHTGMCTQEVQAGGERL